MTPAYARAALVVALLIAAAISTSLTWAQSPPASFSNEQIAAGTKLYVEHCAVCHGPDMVEQGGGFFDLRTFPPAQRSRFMQSVSAGKNGMPPWRGVLTEEQIGNLFAYVVAGARK